MLKNNKKPSQENISTSRPFSILNHSLLIRQSPPTPYKRYDLIDNPPSAKSMFIISKGVAGLRSLLSDGRRSISALYVAKDIVESGIFNRSRKNEYLIALTDLEGCWCDLKDEENSPRGIKRIAAKPPAKFVTPKPFFDHALYRPREKDRP